MNTVTTFEMKIVEMFRFSDGRTVFVGPIETNASFLGACRCELVVDGVSTSIINIEGEMMPDHQHEKGYRSLSSLDAVDLESDAIQKSDCRLRQEQR
ncbi:MAG: hypothetical protein U9N87_06075 [Planctomycetota bacterium]|nr:hypothetical protein [Planctomycetota bacterium]